MAKHTFTIAEKYAVYRILGPNCVWCHEPVSYNESEVDHVIPESMEKEKVDELISHYKLATNFQLNSFYNWAPIHPKCNKRKLAKTFKKAPFIGGILHNIEDDFEQLEKEHELAKKRFSNPIVAAQLENALKNKLISISEIEELLSKNNVSVKTKTNVFGCKINTIEEKGKYGKKRPKQIYDITYQEFDTDVKPLIELNSLVKAEATKELINARENYYSYASDLEDDEACTDNYHEYSMGYRHLTKKFVSYTSNVRFFNAGAAHDQYTITGHSFYLNPLRPFDLESILKDYPAFINKITPLAYDKMIADIKLRMPDEDFTEYSPIEKDWLTQDNNSFKNYHFSETGLSFIFNPYEISAWVFGPHFPEFSFDELIILFPEETEFVKFISSLKKSVSEFKKKKSDKNK